MSISTGLRLFRFLLSLVLRLRRSCGCIVIALRSQLTALCRSILTFTRRSGQSHSRLHASNVLEVDSSPVGECLQSSEATPVEEENGGTLAVLPVRPTARWQEELSHYRALTSGHQFKYDPHPATPETASQRYKLKRFIGQSPGSVNIPPGKKTLLSAVSPPPAGWRRHVSPEGNVLFYHEGLRIFTESDIVQYETEIIFYATNLIQQAIEMDDTAMDELTEIVLNVDENRRWYYYFVDHRNRFLFWVHSVNSSTDLGIDLQRVAGHDHIRYLVAARYWYASFGLSGIVYNVKLRSHCEYYPHDRILPKDIFEYLRGMLNYAKTDMMTADSSTSPFAQDELVAMLDLVNSLKDDRKITNPYSVWVTARLLSSLTETQFLNFCGQSCARLNADAPLYGQQTWNNTITFKIINVFLFWKLDEYAVRLQRLWVDGIIIQPRWGAFIDRLMSELTRHSLLSTVMLAVNVSLLAVPGVVTTYPPPSSPAPTEILIYCSIVAAIGSIAFTFNLTNLYGHPGLRGASTGAETMRVLSQKKWGMACLAVTHSLPIALLVWSIVFFAAALAVQFFDPGQALIIMTVGVECLILGLFLLTGAIVMSLHSKNNSIRGAEPPPRPERDVELASSSQATLTALIRR